MIDCEDRGQCLAQAGSFAQSNERTPWILSKISYLREGWSITLLHFWLGHAIIPTTLADCHEYSGDLINKPTLYSYHLSDSLLFWLL